MANAAHRMAVAAMRRLSSDGAILCFHSVTTVNLPSASIVHLRLPDFKRTINLARELGSLVPLRDIVRRHMAGQSTAGLIGITCDDAYAALLGEAGAFVREEAIPLTVFVVTGAADAGSRYWWDRVADLIPLVSAQRWRQFEEECGLPETYREGQSPEYGPLRPLRQWLLAEHQGRWPCDLAPKLSALEREAGFQTSHRSMTYEELACFTDTPSVDIGVHTVTHPVLPLLPDAKIKAEVRNCFAELRERFERCVPLLAAPYGLYDGRTIRVARECGMSGTLTLGGTTLRGCQPHEGVPRFCLTNDQKRWKLMLRLSGIFRGVREWYGRPVSRFPDLPSPTT